MSTFLLLATKLFSSDVAKEACTSTMKELLKRVSSFGCTENCTNRCPVAYGAGRLMCIIHVFKMHLASCAWLYSVVMYNQSTSHVCKLCHHYYVVYYSPGESTEMHSLCAPTLDRQKGLPQLTFPLVLMATVPYTFYYETSSAESHLFVKVYVLLSIYCRARLRIVNYT